ncbi:hypothetical protein NMY22_g10064 [Coprinellus aureogranulatus]|nr:hypothetical protein NMY22_g10064 [Coprinellus aureogranulatus]
MVPPLQMRGCATSPLCYLPPSAVRKTLRNDPPDQHPHKISSPTTPSTMIYTISEPLVAFFLSPHSRDPLEIGRHALCGVAFLRTHFGTILHNDWPSCFSKQSSCFLPLAYANSDIHADVSKSQLCTSVNATVWQSLPLFNVPVPHREQAPQACLHSAGVPGTGSCAATCEASLLSTDANICAHLGSNAFPEALLCIPTGNGHVSIEAPNCKCYSSSLETPRCGYTIVDTSSLEVPHVGSIIKASFEVPPNGYHAGTLSAEPPNRHHMNTLSIVEPPNGHYTYASSSEVPYVEFRVNGSLTTPQSGFFANAAGGGLARAIPFTSFIDQYILSSHRSSLYPNYSLKFVSYGTVDGMNLIPGGLKDPVYANLPLALLIPLLTISTARDVLLHHGVALPSRAKRVEVDTVLSTHICHGCVNLGAVLEIVPGKQMQTNARKKVYRAKNDASQSSELMNTARDDIKLAAKPRSKKKKDIVNEEDDSPRQLNFVREECEQTVFPPCPLDPEIEAEIAARACAKFEPAIFEEAGCAVCGMLVPLKELSKLKSIKGHLDVLEREGCAKNERNTSEDPVGGYTGPVLDTSCDKVCNDCRASLRKGTIPKYALANGLWLGAIPKELSELRYVERLLVAKVRHTVCWAKVSTGMRKMKANFVAFESPMPHIYERLPPPKADIEEVLAILFTGPTRPTTETYKRTPFLVRRNHVARALRWLKLNHSDYADIDISQSNLNSYPEDVPPVTVEYIPKTGNKSAENTSIFDMEDEDGTEEGECPFTVHGITARDIETASIRKLKARAVHHLNNEGRFLNIGQLELVSMWNNPQLYPQMFPWLFPYGLGGVGSVEGLSNRMHKRRLLMYHDKRFQKDPNFPFIAFSHEQMGAASTAGRIVADRSNFNEITDRLLSVDPTVLQALATRMANGEIVKAETDMEKQCWKVVQDLDCVMSNVSGSITTKKNMRNEVWSLVASQGSPSWYFTMAPVDTKHPLCIYFASDNEKFTPEIGPEKDRFLKICQNPVAAARFFDYMVNVFITSLMGFGIDARGIFGDVSAYYATVEQQGRLTLHIHMLIWLKGNLSPQEMRQRIMNDMAWQKAVVEWLESTHCGEFSTGTQAEVAERADEIESGNDYAEVETLPIPPPQGQCTGNKLQSQQIDEDANQIDQECDCNMNESQLEKQPCDCKYCKSRQGWWSYFLYRFDTVFLRSNVHSCQRYINLDGSTSKKMVYRACTDNQFKRCRARFPRPLHAKTKVDPATGALVMKKGEAWVNFVNRVTTFIMGCNTDVTCLLSGTAVKAVIVYVTDYITKQGLKTHVLYDAIQSIITKSTEILVGDMKAKEKARRLMTRIVNLISAKMEMGAPMISLYLLGNPDHYTSHTFRPMYWKQYMIEARRAFLDEAQDDSADKLMLMKKEGRYIGLSLVHDYIYRPSEVEELCVYEFVQRCTRVVLPRGGEGQLSKSMYAFKEDHPLSATHALRVNCGNVSKIVPNILGPALPRRDTGDPGDYAVAMLSLFKPWRSGLDLRSEHASWHDAFVNYDFPKRFTQIMNNINLKYECLDARDDYRTQMRQSAGMCGSGLHGIDFEVPEDGVLAPEWTLAEEGLELDALENGALSSVEMDRLRKAQDMTAVLRDAGWDQTVAAYHVERHNRTLQVMPSSHWRGLVQNKRLEVANTRANHIPAKCEERKYGKSKWKSDGDVFVADKSYLLKCFTNDNKEHTLFVSKSIKEFNLNYEQEKAFRIVANHATDPYSEVLHMYIGGMGGTGKSQVLKALSYFFSLRKESYRLIVVAPTGSAAALLGGMTYHSAFGINDKADKANLAAVNDRLTGVDYVFFDEISMLSCRDLYRISARLCRVLNNPDESFGGLNMILVGDFAQLPPAVGGEPTSLYGHIKYAPGNLNKQKELIGQSIWHEFTTVVMLKQNMRQVKKGDEAFRTMLENMRYKDCTWDDIHFLRSRISSNLPGHSSICSPEFRNVSVITTRNLLKDTMNDIGSRRFASESNQELSHFYSEDCIAIQSAYAKGLVDTDAINH